MKRNVNVYPTPNLYYVYMPDNKIYIVYNAINKTNKIKLRAIEPKPLPL